jgi:anti-sigma B factor antagonist
MEIDRQEFKHCDLIAAKGRVDSFTASQLAEAFETSHKNGQFKIVLDMQGLNYMSSAGFRALLVAQN